MCPMYIQYLIVYTSSDSSLMLRSLMRVDVKVAASLVALWWAGAGGKPSPFPIGLT
jgi:hypothetical protein